MHIATTKDTIAAPLALVAGAADTRGTVPMLGTVLLKATDAGQLSMLCSDTALLARTLTPVEVKQGGEIAVDVRRLHELIRAVPDKQPIEFHLERDKDTLLVKSGRSRFRLPTLPAADYPRMAPEKEERISITMAADRLGAMIGEITGSMATGDVRAYLNGALFSLDAAGLWLVSTDGHRLTVAHEPIAGVPGQTLREVVVPRKTVLLAKKLLTPGTEITLTLGAKNIQIAFAAGTALLGNGIDGKYPQWRAVVPAHTRHVAVSCERLGNALGMLAAAGEDSTSAAARKKIDLHVAKGVIALRRGDAGVCEVEPASMPDGEFAAALNIDYLANAVDAVRSAGDTVLIGFGAPDASLTVQPDGKTYPLCVVMPMRG